MVDHAQNNARKTVLIADDDGDLSHLLVLRCKQMGLEVLRSPDAMHALLGAHRARPHLIILDVHMPSGSGLSVCDMLAGDAQLRTIPVIVMTGRSDDAIRRRCQELGVSFVEKSATLWDRLEPLIKERLSGGVARSFATTAASETSGVLVQPEAADRTSPAPEAAPLPVKEPEAEKKTSGGPTILCIDDDPEISKILKLRLAEYGVDVLRAFNGMQGYWTALDMKPNVIVLDLNMPDGNGNYIIGRLKMHPLTQKIPILVLTGQSTPGTRRVLFAQGIDGLLTKPLDFAGLLEGLRQFVPLAKQVERGTPADATFRAPTLAG